VGNGPLEWELYANDNILKQIKFPRYNEIVSLTLPDGSERSEDNQRSVDASDGIVAESGLDGGHPGVNKVGHGESVLDNVSWHMML
jgi:hypothetical protein